ncbi:metal ABC transporter ATP-binding protein [Brachybacterium sp. JHP9]|uniref:Metal ABC transporter ATP-binding protein n=1 Tax=Brachybacterium equifaecis TaxID=2910770 RepID=A0ABT0R139_9MICO|nr:metal ABC transporter ATP-binding protein [Brachybacterium equifaecis]MCL6423632.1 metal ABC transporter ATP-binding protein [Brachybacterium equifaecis]
MSASPAPSGSAPAPSGAAPAPVIAARDVHVHLGGTSVLHDVDLTVQRGELVALLGANGSGKSTLLRSLVGILPLDEGRIELFGSAVAERSVHARLGYVPQYAAEPGTIPATAREMVATGLLGPRRWFSRAKDPRIDALLADLGLSALADRPVNQMSGGQRQRVMIARALVRSPELLVLDEPFSGVDVATQDQLAILLRRLVSRGTTIVVVLHELGVLAGDISRAVVLDQGRIIHDGDPSSRPLIDPGHDHALDAAACLGQEIHP